MPREFIFFFVFRLLFFVYFILFFDPFEILSHHLTAESPYWFREEVQRIINKVFREELMI